MAIRYDDLLSVGLPIVDRWFECSDGGARSLCIIGPPKALVEQHAPCMWDAMSNDRSRQIEFDRKSLVKDAVEAQWRWAMDQDESRTRMIVICIPPGVRMGKGSLPRGDRSHLIGGFPSCQALLLVTLLDCRNAMVFVLVDDAELRSKDTRAFARRLGAEALKSMEPRLADRYTLETALVRGSACFGCRSKLSWSVPPAPIYPAWCWTRPVASQSLDVMPSDESRAAVLALSETARGPSDGPVFYMRALTSDVADEIADTSVEMGRLMDVYNGSGDRNEDDRLIPIEVALRSGIWSPTGVDQEQGIYESLSHGYPITALNDICEQIDLLEKSAVEIPPSTGDLLESPEWLSDKVIRFRGTDDARFLRLALRDLNVWRDIRCRAYGSYDRPGISAQMIRRTMIPWPRESERRRLLDAIDKFGLAVAESDDDVQYLQCAIEQLKESEASDLSPWRLAEYVECITGPLRTIQERFRTFLPMERPWPALIAIIRSEVENELDPVRRLNRLFWAAEMMIRYDALVLFSVLRKVEPSRLVESSSTCTSLAEKGHATFGEWRNLQQSSARQLRDICIQSIQDDYRRFRESIEARDEGAIESSSSDIIRARNVAAHGPLALSESQACAEADRLMPQLDKLQGAIAFHREYPPVYIEHIHRTRSKMEVDIRELVGREMPRNRTQRPADSPVGSALAEEVYLDLGEYEGLHPLWPWVLFERRNDSDEGDMLLFDGIKDGIKGNSVQYVSRSATRERPFEMDNQRALETIRRSLGWKCSTAGGVAD